MEGELEGVAIESERDDWRRSLIKQIEFQNGVISVSPNILSPGELRALVGSSLGFTTLELANAIDRSEPTIKRQRSIAIRKLGARSMVHAIGLAFRPNFGIYRVTKPVERQPTLTQRMVRFAEELSEGKQQPEVASSVWLAPITVKLNLTTLYKSLPSPLKNASGLVFYAHASGHIDTAPSNEPTYLNY